MLGLAENIATQPSLAGDWAELGKNPDNVIKIYKQPSVSGNGFFKTVNMSSPGQGSGFVPSSAQSPAKLG